MTVEVTFLFFCDKNLWQKQPQRRRNCSGLQFRRHNSPRQIMSTRWMPGEYNSPRHADGGGGGSVMAGVTIAASCREWPGGRGRTGNKVGYDPQGVPRHLCQPARSYLPTVLQLPKKGSLAEGPNIWTREPGARGEQDKAFPTQTIITFKNCTYIGQKSLLQYNYIEPAL